MKKSLLILLSTLIVFSFQILSAGENGGFAGSYLRMGLGARSQALGNAGVADQSNGFAFYYNPALTGFIESKVVSFSYSFLSQDRRFNFIGYSMKVPPGAGFAVGWINSGFDNIKSYNLIGEETGEIGHSTNGIYFNVARQFQDRFAVGISIKYLWEKVDLTEEDYFSSGLGWDLGAVFKINENLSIAGTVRDMSSKLKASTDKLFEHGGTTIDRFPVIYVLGARYVTPLPWLRVLYDYESSNKSEQRHHLGLEAVHQDLLALRLGLNGRQLHFGAGMGFTLFKYNSKLDYAFTPGVIDEGGSHIFSWQIYLD